MWTPLCPTWIGTASEFLEKPLESQPRMTANISIMVDTMKKFGSDLSSTEERKLKH